MAVAEAQPPVLVDHEVLGHVLLDEHPRRVQEPGVACERRDGGVGAREHLPVPLGVGQREHPPGIGVQRRVEQREGRHPLAVGGGVLERDPAAEAVSDQRRLVDAGLLEHLVEVEHVLLERMRPRPRRAAVAAQVVGDHAPVAAQHAGEPLEAARVGAGAMHADHGRQVAGSPFQDVEPAHASTLGIC